MTAAKAITPARISAAPPRTEMLSMKILIPQGISVFSRVISKIISTDFRKIQGYFFTISI